MPRPRRRRSPPPSGVVDRFPGGINARRFLKEYWQKKPLLIRTAIPDFRTLPGRAGLFVLARNGNVESRLVLERHGDYPWQVLHGPFTRARLQRLPATHWSLLVQGVNFHDPATAALLDRFTFVPNWRIDDVMFSYAPDHGSVGPHLDSYDVFLLQTSGRRRWRISTRRYGAKDLLPGLDLGILGNFRHTQEWTLEPGDMLYLPPGIAHHGIADGHSITCSVGFRAPSNNELLGAVVDSRPVAERRLVDPGLALQRDPGQITATQLRQLRNLVRSALPGQRELDRWLGRQLTQLPPAVPDPAPGPRLSTAALAVRLGKGASLVRAPAVRCAFLRGPRASAWLFVNGGEYETGAGLAARISGPGPVHWRPGRGAVSRAEAQLLCRLVRTGALILRG